MADTFTTEQRSIIMRSVKSKRNKSTEQSLICFFRKNKIIGWRRNYRLEGKPDFVFPKDRIVVFTDGCFWHGHDCRNTTPSQNRSYWQIKIEKNRSRDEYINRLLVEKGWKVIRLWECSLKDNDFLRNVFCIIHT
jgi:DNA mismatch endonuclease (patch repair protein)